MNPARPHLHLVTDPGQSEEDRLREERIASLAAELKAAGIAYQRAAAAGPMAVSRAIELQEKRRVLQVKLHEEVLARSPAQIARMERERGLRK